MKLFIVLFVFGIPMLYAYQELDARNTARRVNGLLTYLIQIAKQKAPVNPSFGNRYTAMTISWPESTPEEKDQPYYPLRADTQRALTQSLKDARQFLADFTIGETDAEADAAQDKKDQEELDKINSLPDIRERNLSLARLLRTDVDAVLTVVNNLFPSQEAL